MLKLSDLEFHTLDNPPIETEGDIVYAMEAVNIAVDSEVTNYAHLAQLALLGLRVKQGLWLIHTDRDTGSSDDWRLFYVTPVLVAGTEQDAHRVARVIEATLTRQIIDEDFHINCPEDWDAAMEDLDLINNPFESRIQPLTLPDALDDASIRRHLDTLDDEA